ncbi:hypothetical protein EJD97_022174 [Solanum chilense]|uniref:Uncharacterized protein n=1 Tax=Solanum chilense TaxID=4083 RepID=A0A6N2AY26_SOLCI|nr:hypothetical protein EJD97_022174 [Solanum chilense]
MRLKHMVNLKRPNNVCGCGNGRGRYNNRRGGGHHKKENNMFSKLYQKSLKRKGNENGASSSNTRKKSYLTYKNDSKARPSQKYDDNIEANLTLKDDDCDDLDDIRRAKEH